jgi:hypothetical protein
MPLLQNVSKLQDFTSLKMVMILLNTFFSMGLEPKVHCLFQHLQNLMPRTDFTMSSTEAVH